eukprot:6804716-Lingulodinium_polyedra.AAC.1
MGRLRMILEMDMIPGAVLFPTMARDVCGRPRRPGRGLSGCPQTHAGIPAAASRSCTMTTGCPPLWAGAAPGTA